MNEIRTISLPFAMQLIFTIGFVFFLLFAIRAKSLSSVLVRIYFVLVSFFALFQTTEAAFYIRSIWDSITIALFLVITSRFFIEKRVAFPPKIQYFFLFSASFWISVILNENSIYNSFIEYRYFITPLVLFLFIYSSELSPAEILENNQYLLLLFSWQIVASVIKFLVVGQMEPFVGSIVRYGGVISTLFALSGSGFMISFFLLYKRKRIYLLLVVGFAFIAWVGDKRGYWFYLPILVSLLYIPYQRMKYSTHDIVIRYSRQIPLLIIFPLALIIGGTYIPTLNPEGKVGGEFDFDYLTNYAQEYSFSVNEEGSPTQRLSGTVSVISHFLNLNAEKVMFGYGPTFIQDKKKNEDYSFKGFWGRETGFNYGVISFGIVGFILILGFYYALTKNMYRIAKKAKTPYWRGISLGTLTLLFLFFIDLLTYSRSMLLNQLLSPTLFYFLGITSRQYSRKLEF